MFAIGIDIGGMSVKAGLVSERGEILSKNRRETADSAELLVKNAAEQINEILNEKKLSVKDINGIGIGSPGIIDSVHGVVKAACNLPFSEFDIVSEMKKYFDVPVKVSNDANVAALGETIFGCAKDYNNSVMFTLGTGVGGGVVIDNKLYEGGSSMGCELGHVTLVAGGLPCNCGRKGCIESYCSATALIRQTKEEMLNNKKSSMWDFVNNDIDKVDGRTAFECSKAGDASANTVVNNYVMYLSDAIMSMLNIFRPEAVILGGGVSAQKQYLTDKIKVYCKKYKYGYEGTPAPEILTATLGNDAGIIGAAALIYS